MSEPRYSCGMNGQCEVDSRGRWNTLAACEANCQASDHKEVSYLVFGYAPEQADYLAPSDRIELIRRETKVFVAPEDSYTVYVALAREDLDTLVQYPILYSYLEREYDYDNLVNAYRRSGQLAALDRLEILEPETPFENYDQFGNFLQAAQYNDAVVTRLMEMNSELVLETLTLNSGYLPALLAYIHLNGAAITSGTLSRYLTIYYTPEDVEVLDYLEQEWPAVINSRWLESMVSGSTAQPSVIKWLLRRYPEYATVDNIRLALRYSGKAFLRSLAKNYALGLEAYIEIATTETFIFREEARDDYSDEENYELPLPYDTIRKKLDLLQGIFRFREEDVAAFTEQLWSRFILATIEDRSTDNYLWLLLNTDFSCEFAHQHHDAIQKWVDRLGRCYLDPEEQEAFTNFLEECDFTSKQ